jgi:hypothetical protein
MTEAYGPGLRSVVNAEQGSPRMSSPHQSDDKSDHTVSLGKNTPPPPSSAYPPPQQQQQGYGQQPYPQPGYGQPYPGYGQPYPAPRGTNTMAILALVFGILVAPLGLVFGFVARSQIKKTGEDGDGLALAGIIIGGIFTLLFIAYIVFIIIFFAAVASSVPLR